MSVEQLTTVASGFTVTKGNAHIFKDTLGNRVDGLFDGEVLIGSMSDLYDRGLREIMEEFYPSVGKVASQEWKVDVMDTCIIFYTTKTFASGSGGSGYKLTKQDRNALNDFNEKHTLPYGKKPLKFTSKVWSANHTG